MRTSAFSLLLFFLSFSASAEEKIIGLIGVETYQISLLDNITDNCWTNAKAIKNAVELSLIKANLTYAESLPDIRVNISAIGMEISSKGDKKLGCAGVPNLYATRFGEFKYYKGGLSEDTAVKVWNQDSFFVSGDNLNSQFREAITSWGDDLALSIVKSNR